MPPGAESTPGIGRLLLRVARIVVRGDSARFVLADLDDSIARDLDRGLPSWRVRLRLGANIVASAVSVARDWRPRPTVFLIEMGQSARALWRDPSFSVPVVLTLTLTIGATSAVFGVIDTVLLRPLPYPEDDRIRAVNVTYTGRTQRFGMSAARVDAMTIAPGVFETIGWNRTGVMTLTGHGEALELDAGRAGPDLFDTLGIEPILGGGFAARARSGERVAYLHETFWRQEFGADPAVLEQRIEIDDVPTTIAGVISAEQAFPSDRDIWVPLLLEDIPDNELHSGNMTVLARLQPEATDAELESQLARLTQLIQTQYPGSYPDSATRAIPLRELIVDDADDVLLVMLAAVGLLFTLGSANVANLVLVRNRRQRAMVATRAALGGSRAAIVRWLLTEMAVLGGLAAVGGALLASNLAPALLRLTQINGPGMVVHAADVRTIAFTAIAALAASLVVGLLPALGATKMDLADVLRSGGLRTSPGKGARRSQGALVAGQAALGVVLVVVAMQTLGELRRMSQRDEGFRTDGIVSLQTRAPESRYANREQFEQLFRDLVESLATLPGVTAAGGTSHLPIGPALTSFGISIEDFPPDDPNQMEAAHGYLVLPGYLETIQVPLLAGRMIESSDTPDSEPVALVSRAFAERYWPDESALGKRIKRRTYSSPFPWITIVGVVENVANDGIDGAPHVAFHMVHGQTATSFHRRMNFVVQSDQPIEQLGPALRARVAEADPDLPVAEIASFDDLLLDARATQRLAGVMVAVFAGFGLILLATGTYGVAAFAATERRAELGIRSALGAESPAILALVLRSSLTYLAAGAAVGLLAAFAISRTFDPNVVPPPTAEQFAIAASALVAIGLASALVPALRASRVDPVRSLR